MKPIPKQAILLAGGYGTRLRPLTDRMPKCLVPIQGKPLLFIWIEHLAEAGIEQFYINTHYLPDAVNKAVASHPLSERITLFHEPELLGTAGTVRAMLNLGICPVEDSLVLHADNLCFCDWADFLAAHRSLERPFVGQMMSFDTDVPSQCGILEVDENNALVGFHEKVENPPGTLANAAIYSFTSEGMDGFLALKEDKPDISLNVVPGLMGRLKVWQNDVYLRDIGTPAAYAQAQQEVKAFI